MSVCVVEISIDRKDDHGMISCHALHSTILEQLTTTTLDSKDRHHEGCFFRLPSVIISQFIHDLLGLEAFATIACTNRSLYRQVKRNGVTAIVLDNSLSMVSNNSFNPFGTPTGDRQTPTGDQLDSVELMYTSLMKFLSELHPRAQVTFRLLDISNDYTLISAILKHLFIEQSMRDSSMKYLDLTNAIWTFKKCTREEVIAHQKSPGFMKALDYERLLAGTFDTSVIFLALYCSSVPYGPQEVVSIVTFAQAKALRHRCWTAESAMKIVQLLDISRIDAPGVGRFFTATSTPLIKTTVDLFNSGLRTIVKYTDGQENVVTRETFRDIRLYDTTFGKVMDWINSQHTDNKDALLPSTTVKRLEFDPSNPYASALEVLAAFSSHLISCNMDDIPAILSTVHISPIPGSEKAIEDLKSVGVYAITLHGSDSVEKIIQATQELGKATISKFNGGYVSHDKQRVHKDTIRPRNRLAILANRVKNANSSSQFAQAGRKAIKKITNVPLSVAEDDDNKLSSKTRPLALAKSPPALTAKSFPASTATALISNLAAHRWARLGGSRRQLSKGSLIMKSMDTHRHEFEMSNCAEAWITKGPHSKDTSIDGKTKRSMGNFTSWMTTERQHLIEELKITAPHIELLWKGLIADINRFEKLKREAAEFHVDRTRCRPIKKKKQSDGSTRSRKKLSKKSSKETSKKSSKKSSKSGSQSGDGTKKGGKTKGDESSKTRKRKRSTAKESSQSDTQESDIPLTVQDVLDSQWDPEDNQMMYSHTIGPTGDVLTPSRGEMMARHKAAISKVNSMSQKPITPAIFFWVWQPITDANGETWPFTRHEYFLSKMHLSASPIIFHTPSDNYGAHGDAQDDVEETKAEVAVPATVTLATAVPATVTLATVTPAGTTPTTTLPPPAVPTVPTVSTVSTVPSVPTVIDRESESSDERPRKRHMPMEYRKAWLQAYETCIDSRDKVIQCADRSLIPALIRSVVRKYGIACEMASIEYQYNLLPGELDYFPDGSSVSEFQAEYSPSASPASPAPPISLSSRPSPPVSLSSRPSQHINAGYSKS